MENLKVVLISLFLGLGAILAFVGWLASWVKLIQGKTWWRSNYKKVYFTGGLFIAIGLALVLFWQ